MQSVPAKQQDSCAERLACGELLSLSSDTQPMSEVLSKLPHFNLWIAVLSVQVP